MSKDQALREPFEALAKAKAQSILEPDPNHPDDDSFMLRFPHGCKLVEGREFWRGHLTELLAEFAWQAASESKALQELIAAAEQLLAWQPQCSVGSSGDLRQKRLRKVLDSWEPLREEMP